MEVIPRGSSFHYDSCGCGTYKPRGGEVDWIWSASAHGSATAPEAAGAGGEAASRPAARHPTRDDRTARFQLGSEGRGDYTSTAIGSSAAAAGGAGHAEESEESVATVPAADAMRIAYLVPCVQRLNYQQRFLTHMLLWMQAPLSNWGPQDNSAADGNVTCPRSPCYSWYASPASSLPCRVAAAQFVALD